MDNKSKIFQILLLLLIVSYLLVCGDNPEKKQLKNNIMRINERINTLNLEFIRCTYDLEQAEVAFSKCTDSVTPLIKEANKLYIFQGQNLFYIYLRKQETLQKKIRDMKSSSMDGYGSPQHREKIRKQYLNELNTEKQSISNTIAELKLEIQKRLQDSVYVSSLIKKECKYDRKIKPFLNKIDSIKTEIKRENKILNQLTDSLEML